MKVCSVDGCGKKHVARGLCGNHYGQQYQPNRHRKEAVTCDECGTVVQKFPSSRYPRRFCSLTCRDVARRRDTRAKRLPVLHPDPWLIWGSCHLPAWPQVRTAPRFFAGQCRRCGAGYIADRLAYENGSGRHCSVRCAKAAGRDRRRARKRSAYVADVYRYRVFERDGWRCQICKRKVSRTASVPNPRAATLDHIIPLAAGGTHEPTNCQTACFKCNATKGHLRAGDQLRLIA